MKSLITLPLLFVFTSVLLAKDPDTSAKIKEAPQAAGPKYRIEEVFENNRKLIRFHDKAGKKIKEIDLGSKETKIRISKERIFDRNGFKVNISTEVAEAIESLRKRSGRDVEHLRQETLEGWISDNKKYLVLEESRLDFVEYADIKSDSEFAEDPIETGSITRVYDTDGKEILTFTEDEGRGATVSNSGNFFLIAYGDVGGRIINSRKEVLAEIPFNATSGYFSDSDRYFLLVNDSIPWGKATISVFDTKENKLELEKLEVEAAVVRGIKKVEIFELQRELVITHSGDVKTRTIKVDRIRF